MTIPIVTKPIPADKTQDAINSLINQINVALGPFNSAAVVITGGTINGVSINASTIGATTPSTGSFTALTATSGSINGDGIVTLTAAQTLTNKALSSPVISGGTINGTAIGGVTPAAGAFTTVSASNFILGNQGVLISSELLTLFPNNFLPQFYTLSDDNNTGGLGNPKCSITLSNTGNYNHFGELAFNLTNVGAATNTDVWALQQDRTRNKTDDLSLIQYGQLVQYWAADRSFTKYYQNVIIDGVSGSALQSTNAAGTATLNTLRIAGGDYLQLGTVSSSLSGIQFYPGSFGLAALALDGPTGKATFSGQVALDKSSSSALNRLMFTTSGVNNFNIGTGIYSADNTNFSLGSDSTLFMNFTSANVCRLTSLAGSGSRFVQADASGNLSTTATVVAAAGTLTGATLASNVTSSSLTSFGATPTLTTPNIVGTNTNNNAAAGSVGEIITANNIGSPISLTTNTTANVISIPLTAGDWDVHAVLAYSPASSTTWTASYAGISTTSATFPAAGNEGQIGILGAAGPAGGAGMILPTGTTRLSLASTTTVYLVAQCTFAVSTMGAVGTITARRMR